MIRCVVFDFDFTLADSSEPIQECARYALSKLGFPCPSPLAVARTIGCSLQESFFILTGSTESSLAEAYATYFRELGERIIVARTTLYGFTPALLRALAARNVTCAIVTMKKAHRVHAVLTRHSLLDFVPTIVGGDMVERPKPDPEGLALALHRVGSEPRESMYVGDTVYDAQQARSLGVKFVGVLTGVTQAHEFTEYQPLSVLPTAAEILSSPALTIAGMVSNQV